MVDRRIVREAIRDLGASYLGPAGQRMRFWLKMAGALLLLAMAIMFGYLQWPWF